MNSSAEDVENFLVVSRLAHNISSTFWAAGVQLRGFQLRAWRQNIGHSHKRDLQWNPLYHRRKSVFHQSIQEIFVSAIAFRI